MPKTILYRGLPGDGLDIFIREYRTAAAEDPFGTWLILPTKRLVLKVRRDLAEDSVVLSSRICILQEFCQEYFTANRTGTRILKKAEARFLLHQILQENREKVPLFFSRGAPSSSTLESLQDFIHIIIRRKIDYPSCLGDLQGENSRQLGLVLSLYREQMRARDLVDPDTVLTWTADHLASHTIRFGSVFIYGLYSPWPLEADLLSALRISSDKCSVFIPDGPDEAIFRGGEEWTGSPQRTEMVPPMQHGGTEIAGLFTGNGAISPESGIRCASFASEYEELSRIAEEICRIHEDGVPFADIALAFPEVREKLGLLRDIFTDFAIPWSSATGTLLNRLALVQDLLAVPGIVSREFSREAVLRVVQSRLYQSVRAGGNSSRIPDLDPRELDLVSRLAQVEKWERGWERGFEYLKDRLRELEERGDPLPVSKDALARVKTGILALFRDLAPFKGTHRVREFTGAYRDLLSGWGLLAQLPAKDTRISVEEHAAREKFLACLDRVGNLDGLLAPGPVTCAEFLRILNAVAEEEVFLPDEPGTGVSVVGMEEAGNSRFPYLFLASLTDGNLPRLTTRLPFTNQRENVRMGTRTLDEILREERYRFIAALLAGERAVYLSAPQSDGENPLLSSAFFERVKARIPGGSWADPDTGEIRHSGRADAIRAGNRIAVREFPTALPLLSSETVLGTIAERVTMEQYERDGTRSSPYAGTVSEDPEIRDLLLKEFSPAHIYSPTVLETYAACPLRFFFEKVLNVRALPELELNLSARDRGTAVHNILSAFYREWKSRGNGKVHLSELADAANLMAGIVSGELERYAFRSPAWEATCVQMTGSPGTGPGLFERFLQKETDEEGSPLVPAYFEFTFGMRSDENDDPASVTEPVEISAGEGTEPVRIKGRIDRIDITQDGLFAIYDYKTGTQVATRNEIAAGKALQIPLYLLAFEKISGNQGVLGGYYQIRREVKNRIVLLDDTGKDLVISSNPRVTKDFRTALLSSLQYSAGYIRGIRAGEFPLPAEEKCPNPYCDYAAVCRFDPSRIFSTREET
ncbi:MAG: PD-(D/E)XK nuclease family protein [Methanoregulaceae archaeon]